MSGRSDRHCASLSAMGSCQGVLLPEGKSMATVVLIVVAIVLIAGLTAAMWLQHRRNPDPPFNRDEADAASMHQQRERQGYS